MILYNASTSAGLRNFTRFLTNTNTTTYSNADLDAALNTYYHQFTNDILESMDDWDFQGEVATASLVASQQEYIFPTDLLKIKRVEVSYDGTNWYVAKPFDISERSEPLDTTSVATDFSTTDPYYDAHDISLFLYPIPSSNVSGGLKIWYEKEATELTAVTNEPVFAEAYHKGLAYGAAKDYFEKYMEVAGNANKAVQMEKNLEVVRQRMKDFYARRNQDRDYVMLPAFEDYDY
jgi:hypothetical protein